MRHPTEVRLGSNPVVEGVSAFTSGLPHPLIGDMRRTGLDVGFVPTADVVAFVNSIVVFFRISGFWPSSSRRAFMEFLYFEGLIHIVFICVLPVLLWSDPLAEWHFSKLSGY